MWLLCISGLVGDTLQNGGTSLIACYRRLYGSAQNMEDLEAV